MIFLLFFSYSYPFIVFFLMVDSLGCVQTDATTPSIVGCYILRPFAQPVACCCVLLGVVAQSLEPITPNISVVSWSPKRSTTMLEPFCTARLTFLGPRALITKGFQRVMGCILPTMQCRPQHCWDMLHPFAHHCQHGRNNFQHCWPSNVESCYVRL